MDALLDWIEPIPAQLDSVNVNDNVKSSFGQMLLEGTGVSGVMES